MTDPAPPNDEILKLLDSFRGKPLKDRETTVGLIDRIMRKEGGQQPEAQSAVLCQRSPLTNVYSEGPMIVSDIPQSCFRGKVVLGIDEAGRGSVLGPMTYGTAFWSVEDEEKIPKDFNDSKQLSEDVRSSLLQKILKTPEIGFVARILHASEISRNMLRPEPYNLNAMSHDAAISMIRAVLDAGVQVDTCYIDTVGIAEHYQRRLEREFPSLNFFVESKADAKYAPCSAASVVAKVLRDHLMAGWQFSEGPSFPASYEFGSGYPSDPVCKKWMEDHQSCPVFGFSDVVRFSWNPTKKALEEKAASVLFLADEDPEDGENQVLNVKRQREQMSSFLGKNKRVKRVPYFERRKIRVILVSSLSR